jgi:hypothetical protein
VLIGWFVFGQWPGVEILAGGAIVALAGLFVYGASTGSASCA